MSNKYGRQHGGSNASPWLIWIGGLSLVGFLTWRVIKGFDKAKRIHSIEQQELLEKQEMIDPGTSSDTVVVN